MTAFLPDISNFLPAAAEYLLRLIDSSFLRHGFDVFFAGLFSMPVAIGAFIAAVLTILIAALLVPITAALGLSSGKGIFALGAAILLAAVWAVYAAVAKFRFKFMRRFSAIIPINAAASSGLRHTGFKGNGVGLLSAMNVNTPDGFIINGSVFNKWVRTRKLGEMIAKIAAMEDAEKRIEALFRTTKPPFLFKRKLKKALRTFRGAKIILRSSFPGEDGKTTSMAGVFESVRSDSGIDNTLAALAKVWASHFSQRAAAARSGEEPPAPLFLPVIVQRRIRHDVFFIGCSVNYFNGRLEEMVVSYETPQGGAGVVKFDTFTKGITAIDGQDDYPFGNDTITVLASLLNRLEARYDKPVQIEAGLSGDTLYLYQVRPLTGFKPVETLVNSFIVDIADTPLTPLSKDLFVLPGSLGERMSKRLAPYGFTGGASAFTEHQGRIYLNYSTVRKYLNPHYLALPRFAVRSLVPSMRAAIRLAAPGTFRRRYIKILKRFEVLQNESNAKISVLRNGILLPLFRLQLDLFEFSDLTGGRYDAFIDRVFGNSTERASQAKSLKTAPANSPWKRMLDELRNINTSDENQVAAFKQKFGHWGNPESEIAAPRLADDITPWLNAVPDAGAVAAQKHSVALSEVEQAFRNKWARSTFNTGLLIFHIIYRRQMKIMTLREEVRDTLNRTMSEIRKKALSMNFGEDVFYMTVAEIENVAPGVDVVIKRKSEHTTFLGKHPGAVVHIPDSPEDERESGAISCLGVGNEIVEGTALIADGPASVTNGEKPVLFIARPDGIYGTVIRNISALVIERGSPLSHLVLLAREAGIPVLIGGSGIMGRIANGDRVTVDAGKGVLRIG